MNTQEYTNEVLRTCVAKTTSDQLCLAALGLAGESGEVVDIVKKWLYAGHELDIAHMIEELGDVLWYLTLACHTTGLSLEGVMNVNVAKMRKRFPNGFDTQRSINRTWERVEEEV